MDVDKRLMHGTGLNSVEGAGLFHLLKHWGGILEDYVVGPRVSACWHCPGRIRRDSQIARVKPNKAKFIVLALFTFWMGKMLGFQDWRPS